MNVKIKQKETLIKKIGNISGHYKGEKRKKR